MEKWVPRSWWRVAWGVLGYIAAIIFILGVGLTVRCCGLSDNWQMVAIFGLISMAGLFSLIYGIIRRDRRTHYDYEKRNARFARDIGPGEQKSGQLTVIFVITAITIYTDMWFPVLIKIADKIFPLIF